MTAKVQWRDLISGEEIKAKDESSKGIVKFSIVVEKNHLTMETASHARQILTSHSLDTILRTTYLSTIMHSMKRSRFQNYMSIVSIEEYIFDLNCHTLSVLHAEGPVNLSHHSACAVRH